MQIDKLTEMKIKGAANVVDVLGDFLDLHKKGVNYQALCPFHSDRHLGSFVINPRKNSWRCYSCGQGGNPVDFLILHEHLKYPDTLRWLARKYGIIIPGDSQQASWHHLPKPSKVHQQLPPLPTIELPIGYVKGRLDTRHDTFCNWLRSLPWNEAQRMRLDKMLHLYLVGHARTGHTIFWQLDVAGKVRTGHMMLYKPDGHRDKQTKGANSWIHFKLRHPGTGKDGKPLPPMIPDEDHADIAYQLFGMHILDLAPEATVNIVESEKTALLASIFWGNQKHFLWMACNGLSWLSRERLQPLINENRKIVLYPDRDGIKQWHAKAEELKKELSYDRISVNTTYIDRYWRPETGEKADIGDLIVYSLTHDLTKPASPPPRTNTKTNRQLAAEALHRLKSGNVHIQTLVEKLDLEPITITNGKGRKV